MNSAAHHHNSMLVIVLANLVWRNVHARAIPHARSPCGGRCDFQPCDSLSKTDFTHTGMFKEQSASSPLVHSRFHSLACACLLHPNAQHSTDYFSSHSTKHSYIPLQSLIPTSPLLSSLSPPSPFLHSLSPSLLTPLPPTFVLPRTLLPTLPSLR
eukprot:5177403-Pleurochrysis_carterae.AAC.1